MYCSHYYLFLSILSAKIFIYNNICQQWFNICVKFYSNFEAALTAIKLNVNKGKYYIISI